MLATEEVSVKSGEIVRVSGHYLYLKNAVRGEIPCLPTNEEKAVVLERGQKAPYITSCQNHAAVYELVARKD